jgi:hypothetical protein
MTPDELTEIPGVGEKTVERIRKVVTDYFEQGQSAEGGGEETAQADSATAVETAEVTEAAVESAADVPAAEAKPETDESNAGGEPVATESGDEAHSMPSPEAFEASTDTAGGHDTDAGPEHDRRAQQQVTESES